MREIARTVLKSQPKALARMMQLGLMGNVDDAAEDLGAILREQLDTPLVFDLCGAHPSAAKRVEKLTRDKNQIICSFGFLFRDPQAPVEFLTLGKDFAKANLNHPDSPIPHPVAELLYFTSIAAALVRCGQKITKLDSGSLCHCFKRLAAQAWVDDQTRKVLTEGVMLLE